VWIEHPCRRAVSAGSMYGLYLLTRSRHRQNDARKRAFTFQGRRPCSPGRFPGHRTSPRGSRISNWRRRSSSRLCQAEVTTCEDDLSPEFAAKFWKEVLLFLKIAEFPLKRGRIFIYLLKKYIRKKQSKWHYSWRERYMTLTPAQHQNTKIHSKIKTQTFKNMSNMRLVRH